MHIITNPFLNSGMPGLDQRIPAPSTDREIVARLLDRCPNYATTPTVDATLLAQRAGIEMLWVKDERKRFDLGSFKALGAAYVIAHDAVNKNTDAMANALAGMTYVAASAGNHGLSVAAGARVFGASAVIYISQNVPESFAERLRAKHARVIRAGEDYEQSMAAAHRASNEHGWTLISDSSWAGYYDIPHRLMEGYLQLGTEVFEQIDTIPTHIFLQAGVGGFAGAFAAFARHQWGDEVKIIVVEPDAAPALKKSILAGAPTIAPGPVSTMGRLDCKEPSLIALKGLSRDADFFLTISDEDVGSVLPLLEENGLRTTPSGAAGLAALLLAGDGRRELALTPKSRALTFITESA